MSRFRYILYITLLAVCAGCSDKLGIVPDIDVDINAGDEISFSAQVPQVATRADAKAEYWENINRFERVEDDYVFDVDMYEEGNATKIASATYNPTKKTVDNVTTYDDYGTLEEDGSFLYWPSNVKKYAFHAVSSNSTEKIGDDDRNGNPTGKSDQSTAEKFFKQDRIEGYGYVPGWDDALNEGAGAPVRDLDGLNYLTAKEWYAANKLWGLPDNNMSETQLVEHWKKVPLFMRHKRSRITVLLKAGEGVEREQIKYNDVLTPQNIHIDIFSYDKNNQSTTVTPLLGSYECEYEATNQFPQKETVTTACYDAIVEPHDYTEGSNMTEQKMLAINLSGMKFSFYAANDREFSSAPDAENEVVKTRYNLTEGKHLILEVTLSTDTRKILITAYVVDWEDWPFSSICDDFGQAADPEPISDKADLIEFLTNPAKNKPGNVAVIIPLNLNLNEAVTGAMINKKNMVKDASGKSPDDDGYQPTYKDGYTPKNDNEEIYPAGWDPLEYSLNMTLKLAGATITTNNRLFDKISVSGSIVNGTVVIADKDGITNPEIECAIAKENLGSIDRVTVEQGETERKATRAGLVITNRGTIHACMSSLPVYNPSENDDVWIGGIAAEMLYPTKIENGQSVPDVASQPVIDQCGVNARIDGGSKVVGGGIVGRAEGKLTNNTYNYGITLLQNADRFRNILYAKGGNQDLTTSGNEWPTKVKNPVVGGSDITNARLEEDCYNQVLDSQAELHKLVSESSYNNTVSRYRLASSFSVDGTWDLSVQDQGTGSARGNLLCELDGNEQTITLTGTENAKMLFSNIQSHVYDLVLQLDKPIVAMPKKDGETNAELLPARAPLAYAVVGDKAVLSNIKVRSSDGAFVKSTASGGLVVWAYDGATIEDCKSDVDVRIAVPEGSGNQQTYFVGGLVNSAAKATILRCTYHRQQFNETEDELAVQGSNVYYGGIVGGTNKKGVYDPSLNISDCTSWVSWQVKDELPHTAWGGIIGYSKYQNTLSDLVNATDGNCQGNWWQGPAGASSKGMASGMTEEKVIGKKNSLQPLRDTKY